MHFCLYGGGVSEKRLARLSFAFFSAGAGAKQGDTFLKTKGKIKFSVMDHSSKAVTTCVSHITSSRKSWANVNNKICLRASMSYLD